MLRYFKKMVKFYIKSSCQGNISFDAVFFNRFCFSVAWHIKRRVKLAVKGLS